MASSVKKISSQKADLMAAYNAMLRGIQQDMADVQTFIIQGQSVARADLIAQIRHRIDSAQRANDARSALLAAVAAEKTADAEVRPVRKSVQRMVQARFGDRSPKLQDFGFSQAKVPQSTTATKAKAATLRHATRKARNTLGSKQRLAIKGTLPDATTGTAAPTTAPSADTVQPPVRPPVGA